MKSSLNTTFNKVKDHPHFSKAIHWGKLVSVTGFAQVIVQAVGFLSGILIIRLLPVEEYALYTLANTMLGTMTVLADGGISSGVMAQGGKVWQDKEKLGIVLATGLDLRRKFAIFSLLVSVPILMYLMIEHGASWYTATMIALSLIPAFYAALSDTLLQVPPKLHQAITPLQKNQVGVGLGRLALNAGLLFIFPWTAIALLANGFPRVYGNYRLKKIAAPFTNAQCKPDPKIRKEILTIVRRVMPGAIYYAFSGQITIWLISIFGTTTSIAQLGALGRFAMLYTFISVLLNTLIIPRFARMNVKTIKLQSTLYKIIAIVLGIGLCSVILFKIFDVYILQIIGDQYNHLNKELVLIAISSSLVLLSGTINNLLSSRGIIVPPQWFISLTIATQILAAIILPIDQLIGVIVYSITTTGIIILIRLVYFKIYTIKNATNS